MSHTPTESEQELKELAEFPSMNPWPVCRMDRSGKVLLANAAAKKVFGEQHLLGAFWQSVCPGLDASVWERVQATDLPVLHEADFGGQCYLFTHVKTASGESVFAFGSDVTAHRKAERQLADQAAKLAEVARFPEMNPGPVLRLSTDGSVLLANAAARKIFGDPVVGLRWKDLCPGIDDVFWEAVMATEDPVPHEAQVKECVFIFTHRCDAASKLVFVFGTDVTDQKQAEKALRQSEKMATLGTLAAGVAHELNNPAAATRRAADQLKSAFARLEQALLSIDTTALSAEARTLMNDIETRAREASAQPSDLDPVTRSDLEQDIEEWLSQHDVPGPWELAPALVAQKFDASRRTEMERLFPPPLFVPMVVWAASAFPVYRLLHEISHGSARISEIVTAMKGYSYVGQAPLRMIDIHEGLDNTLVILRNKLKAGVTVRREYDGTIPAICAFGSELNQVWTNLLDNAADAMNGKGEIVIRTARQAPWAVVEIEDNGPGIPKEHLSRIFDPFFTTKAPGQGTGLGLSTTYSIVRDKHQGEISVASRAGRTVFTVKLLLDNPALAHDQKNERS